MITKDLLDASAAATGVARVIGLLHRHLEDPPSLRIMAKVAIQSPFHFIRKFHEATGVPPRLFLSALRLEMAKRLLVTTDRSVTDVSLDVGYNSLGSFITRFTHCVGASPRRLRRLVQSVDASIVDRVSTSGEAVSVRASMVRAHVTAPEGFDGTIFVGLFPSAIPQGLPVACGVLHQSGACMLGPVPDATYYILSAAVPRGAEALRYVLCDRELRGRAGPVTVRGPVVLGDTDVVLRPPDVLDPPLVIALPTLWSRYLARHVARAPIRSES
jgi:AraC family transcriptional regulator